MSDQTIQQQPLSPSPCASSDDHEVVSHDPSPSPLLPNRAHNGTLPNKHGIVNPLSDEINSEQITSVDRFEDMPLPEDLLRGIFSHGFERPSVVQQKCIVPVASGRDVVGQAQSGTGKTAAFSVGSLCRLDCAVKGVQILICEPTRELARQTAGVVAELGSYMGVRVHICVGGTRVRDDQVQLRSAQVVVGTPGRLIDVLERGYLSVHKIRTLVLDEADEMLSLGFVDQMRLILQHVPAETQVALFSATLPVETLEISERFMRNPLYVRLKTEALTLEGIKQFFVDCGRREFKLDTLADLYNDLSVSQSIVFCRSTIETEQVAEYLLHRDFAVGVMHGKLAPDKRKAVYERFRDAHTRVLISTDVLGRGIDVTGVGVVINFSLPQSREFYLHRVGRAGRFGKKGIAISLVTSEDATELAALERMYETQIEPLPQEFPSLV